VIRDTSIAAPIRRCNHLSTSPANFDPARLVIGALIAVALVAEFVALIEWVLA
jgi:hypothetical protein